MKKIIKSFIFAILSLVPKSFMISYLDNFFDKKDKSISHSILVSYFSEYYKNSDQEKQKDIGYLFWRSKSAINYFRERTVPPAIVDRFQNVIEKNDGCVCEVGTGNGYLIDVLSRRFNGRGFVGVDLNEEQTKVNKNAYKNNKSVNFACGDIIDYVTNNKRAAIYISYVSFTTFTPESINKLFERVANIDEPSVLAMYEPVEPGVVEGEKSVTRGGMAYAHNYVHLAKKNGFDVIEKVYDSGNSFLWLVCKKTPLVSAIKTGSAA